MLDPYRMVLVNITCSLLLISGIFSYSFIFPKKKPNLLILLILFSLLPTINIFRPGVYESGDFNIHLYRSMSFYQSLSEGNIIPSWAGALNATYGYPLFIFNYTLPYYIISFFHFFGLSFIASMKFFLGLNIPFSALGMYILVRKMLKSNLGAFTAGVFYIFAPYHLVDLHFKVVIGEILFFTLLPYTLFFVYKLIHEKTSLYTYIVGFLFAFLIMSHIILAVFTSALFFFYALLLRSRKKRKVSFMRIFLSFFIGFGISLYMWVGPIILSKYSFIQKIDLGFAHFPTFLELIYSPWRIGFLFQGPQGETSHLIGYGHLFILIFTFYLLFKRKGIEQFTADQTLWLVFSFIIIFLISPFSKPLWGISFLKVVGSHRLLVLLVFSISILAGYISFYFKKKWILYLLIDVTIFSTILNWGQRRMIPSITDQTLIQNLPLSTSRGEAHFYANTKWVDTKNPWFSKVPKNHLEIINGQGEVKEIQRTSTKHLYLVSAETPLFMKENTLYFPGWKVLNNGVERNVEYQNQTYQGVITFSISQGLHKLEIKYEDIVEYKILKIISMVSFITILLSTIYIAIKKVYQCKET